MNSELSEIVSFLRQTAPFDELGERTVQRLARAITIQYYRKDAAVLRAGETNDRLFIVRSGAVELRLAGDELTARLDLGACFAYPSLLRGGEVRNTAVAL